MASRSCLPLPEFYRVYGGDTLWATLVYILAAFLFNKLQPPVLLAGSLVTSYLVELSQLLHTPWLDAIRNTTLGGLVLGFGFLWSDLLCYTAGVVMALGLDLLILHYFGKTNYTCSTEA